MDWTKIIKKYAGRWVALKDDEITVVASGLTPEDTIKKATKKGYNSPIITRMSEEVLPFVG